MVGDFSKVLKGLKHASQVPEMFRGIDIQSDLLRKIVRPMEQGGCFPDMASDIEWLYENFDFAKAEKGEFEPSLGVDQPYDAACATIEQIEGKLQAYKNDMCSNFLRPSSQARSTWKYANILPESKDKYMIELPASVSVPNDFVCKGKRGSGNKQVNKYRTTVVESLVQDLDKALDIKSERRALGMELFFAKFDTKRDLWGSASQAISLLDALCSLSMVSSKPGYCRPTILDCPPETEPSIHVVQGRHPCVEGSKPDSSDFVPNDLSLGTESSAERVLLLSGPNMGG
jgi:DNA mismatch repair protein MSH6